MMMKMEITITREAWMIQIEMEMTITREEWMIQIELEDDLTDYDTRGLTYNQRA